jgi:hypothetical protein
MAWEVGRLFDLRGFPAGAQRFEHVVTGCPEFQQTH